MHVNPKYDSRNFFQLSVIFFSSFETNRKTKEFPPKNFFQPPIVKKTGVYIEEIIRVSIFGWVRRISAHFPFRNSEILSKYGWFERKKGGEGWRVEIDPSSLANDVARSYDAKDKLASSCAVRSSRSASIRCLSTRDREKEKEGGFAREGGSGNFSCA